MGQSFTQSKNTISPEVETFLLRYIPHLQFVKLLSDHIFMKTVLCVNDLNGEPLVCKIYFKNEKENIQYNTYLEKLKDIRVTYDIRTASPNVAPIISLINLDVIISSNFRKLA
jgi:hypothetical protein